VIFRPWKLPEAVWAVSGALLLPLLGLLPLERRRPRRRQGHRRYLFLVGMMLLAELARREGLFDYAAGVAVRRARGSARRLFTLVYTIGVPG
jgi:arsenical pump membrane protein